MEIFIGIIRILAIPLLIVWIGSMVIGLLVGLDELWGIRIGRRPTRIMDEMRKQAQEEIRNGVREEIRKEVREEIRKETIKEVIDTLRRQGRLKDE